MRSPLEQFEILILQPLRIGIFDFSLTNSAVYSLSILFVLSMLFFLGSSKAFVVPGRWQALLESFYLFLVDMVNQQAGKKAYTFFPLFFTTFCVILGANLLGLTPFGFTVTGHIIITFTLALAFNLGFIFLGLILHKLYFFKLFVLLGFRPFYCH